MALPCYIYVFDIDLCTANRTSFLAMVPVIAYTFWQPLKGTNNDSYFDL